MFFLLIIIIIIVCACVFVSLDYLQNTCTYLTDLQNKLYLLEKRIVAATKNAASDKGPREFKGHPIYRIKRRSRGIVAERRWLEATDEEWRASRVAAGVATTKRVNVVGCRGRFRLKQLLHPSNPPTPWSLLRNSRPSTRLHSRSSCTYTYIRASARAHAIVRQYQRPAGCTEGDN